MHAPFVFSSIQPYPPVAIAVFFYYLEFVWGGAPPPLSGGACHMLATVARLPLSKHTGGGGATPAFSGRLVCLFTVCMKEYLSPTQWSFPHNSHCYKLSLLQGCWAGAATPASPAGLFIYSLCGEVPLRHFPVQHATLQPLLEAFPSPSTLGEVVPLPPSLAGLFIYSLHEGVPLPHSQELRAPCPLCYMSFFFSAACLLFSLVFSLFSLGGVSLSRGLC
jgi:hypothetical protein